MILNFYHGPLNKIGPLLPYNILHIRRSLIVAILAMNIQLSKELTSRKYSRCIQEFDRREVPTVCFLTHKFSKLVVKISYPHSEISLKLAKQINYNHLFP